MSNIIVYGVIITFIVLFLSSSTILVALKFYRPHIHISRFAVMGLFSFLIAGVATIQVVSSYCTKQITSSEQIKYYKIASWIQGTEDSLFTVTEAKELWMNQPSVESKFLYSMALLKNNQNIQGTYLLSEIENQETKYIQNDNLIKKYNVKLNDPLSHLTFTPEMVPFVVKMKAKVQKDLSLTPSELTALTTYSPEKIRYMSAKSEPMDEYELQDFYEEKQEELKHPYIKKELGESFLITGDNEQAEQLLVDVLKEYPNDEQAATQLTEIYLEGELNPRVSKILPQYKYATYQIDQEQILAFKKWDGVKEDILDYQSIINEQTQLSNEVAYSILREVKETSKNPLIDIRLARYYFNTGENQKAETVMNDALESLQQFPVDIQYTISDIQQKMLTDTLATDLTIKQMQTETLYNGFHTRTYQDTLEDKSFSIFLNNTVENNIQKDIKIVGVEPSYDGVIKAYVETKNIQLTSDEIKLLNNNKKIEDFNIEKISNKKGSGILRSIGLVMDISGSMEGVRIEVAKKAVEHFASRIQSHEQADLIAFSSNPSIVYDFTQDKEMIISKAQTLIANGGTNITDALITEIVRLKNQPGQRIIFIMTDGEDSGFTESSTRSSIVSMAKKYGISIYSVGLGEGNLALQDVSLKTGGKYIGTPYESGVISGFEEVSNQLQNVYQITYQVNPVEFGTNILSLSVPNEEIYNRLYTYEIYRKEEMNENVENVLAEEPNLGNLDEVDIGFYINQIFPQQIPLQMDEDKFTEVTITGIGLDQVEILKIGHLKVKKGITKKSKNSLTFKLPNKLSLGKYTLEAITADGKAASIPFEVVETSLLTEIPYGWATLYASHITINGDTIGLSGNPSIDHFIYPSGSSMNLKGDELTFTGMKFKIDQTKTDFFSISNAANSVNNGVNDRFGMEIKMRPQDSIGETFEIKNVMNVSKTFGGNLEFKFNDLSYQADYSKKEGTFKADTELKGIYPLLAAFNQDKLKRKIGNFSFIPVAEGQFVTELSPTKALIKGEATFDSLDYKIIELSQITVGGEYDDISKRWVFNGGVGEINLLKQKLKYLYGVGVTIGNESKDGQSVGIRFGLIGEGNYPLGATGLALNKVGFVMDWTSESEGSLLINVGTIADKAFGEIIEKIIEKINKIPFIDFQKDEAYLFAAELDTGIKKFLKEDWEAYGDMKGFILGFTYQDQKARLTKNFIDFTFEKNMIGLKARNILEFRNPRYINQFTIAQDAELKTIGTDAKLTALLIPKEMKLITYRLKGKLGGIILDVDYATSTSYTYKAS